MVTLAYGAAANNCRSRGLKLASETGEIVPDSTQAQSITTKMPANPAGTARAAICLSPSLDHRIVPCRFVTRNSLRPPDAKVAFRGASPKVLHKSLIRGGDYETACVKRSHIRLTDR